MSNSNELAEVVDNHLAKLPRTSSANDRHRTKGKIPMPGLKGVNFPVFVVVVYKLFRKCLRWVRVHTRTGAMRRQELLDFLLSRVDMLAKEVSVFSEEARDARGRFDHAMHRVYLLRNEMVDLRSSFAKLASVQSAKTHEDHPLIVRQTLTGSPSVGLDSFYLAFEEKFRTQSANLIADLRSVYEPYLKELKVSGRAVDIGCGRGELLEYLRDFGLDVFGVDTNQAMVATCKGKGIEAFCGDGTQYLSSVESNSIGLVTAIHVVEHIPFEALVRFVDEAFRALKPGGVAIFETPNPENIMVGACDFYSDLTHLNPIPPATLDFLVQHRGFDRTIVVRKGKAESAELKAAHEAEAFMLAKFQTPPDYAVIAIKGG